jgi:hypothetical protein
MGTLVLGRRHGALFAPVHALRQRMRDKLLGEALERHRVAQVQLQLRLQRPRLHQLHRHAIGPEQAGWLGGCGQGQCEGERGEHRACRFRAYVTDATLSIPAVYRRLYVGSAAALEPLRAGGTNISEQLQYWNST